VTGVGQPEAGAADGGDDPAERIAALRDALDEMTARHDEAARHLDYLLRRSLPERLLFGRDGRPCRLIRQVLFHRNGKPRGMFKSWLLTPAGRPRAPFRFWMTSPAYRSLPRALRFAPPGLADDRLARAGALATLSPRTARFVLLLDASAASQRPPP
jgi:hypothetical protein